MCTYLMGGLMPRRWCVGEEHARRFDHLELDTLTHWLAW